MDLDTDGTRTDQQSPHQFPSSRTGTGSPGTTSGISDAELLSLLDEQGADITVVGCGGAGCNTVNRMFETGITGAELVSINTDVQHLVESQANQKILISDGQTAGKGAGSLPQVGEQAALNTVSEIEDVVVGSDMVFVTAGLGGGTGTGAAPVVSKMASDAGALTIAVVTMPFSAEGDIRWANAVGGLQRLRDVADTVIVISNDRLLESVGKLPVQQAFLVADELLMRSVKGITELITQPGMVNLDFADLETVLASGGLALIGFGESSSDTKVDDAVRSAIRSPLLDVNTAEATAALVNVTGGETMTIDEAEGVVERIYDEIDPDARIIWGTSIDEDLGDTLRTMIVLTGVSAPMLTESA